MSNPGETLNNGLVLLSTDNQVFCCYAFWASILVLKMIIMSLLTAFRRFQKQSYINPEDLVMRKAPEVQFNDPDVERVRRAHRNDLENIVPYLIICLPFIAAGPNATVARLLFCLSALARIVHTAVYAFRPVPQPCRAIAFFVTFFITVYMVFYIVAKTVVHI